MGRGGEQVRDRHGLGRAGVRLPLLVPGVRGDADPITRQGVRALQRVRTRARGQRVDGRLRKPLTAHRRQGEGLQLNQIEPPNRSSKNRGTAIYPWKLGVSPVTDHAAADPSAPAVTMLAPSSATARDVTAIACALSAVSGLGSSVFQKYTRPSVDPEQTSASTRPSHAASVRESWREGKWNQSDMFDMFRSGLVAPTLTCAGLISSHLGCVSLELSKNFATLSINDACARVAVIGEDEVPVAGKACRKDRRTEEVARYRARAHVKPTA